MESPPTDLSFAPPQGDLGEPAELWLAAHGFPAYTPTIRSSDYKVCLSDPFLYYLTRRLGLTAPLSWSAALSRGGWLHVGVEVDPFTEAPSRQTYSARLADRLEELTVVCNHLGITGTSRDAIMERETFDADTAWGWYNAARTVKVRPPEYPDFPTFLSRFNVLQREHTISLHSGRIKAFLRDHDIKPFAWPNIVVQYDLLIQDPKGGVWIVDFKTTSYPTADRLSSCPYEFQTQLYSHVFTWAQDHAPDLLPVGCRTTEFRGMLHIAIQKPSIKFGQNDRDFTEKNHTITRGARKGEVEVRRTYRGEPKVSNYIERCRQWYTATGQYEHLAAEREAAPTVNYSRTPWSVTKSHTQTFIDRLRFLMMHATCAPHPRNFLASDSGHLDRSGLSFWAPFYLSPPDDWPTIINELGLIQKFRDEPHMEHAPNAEQ